MEIQILDDTAPEYEEVGRPATIDGREHPGLFNTWAYIGFLGHDHRVEFCNIRIKKMPLLTFDRTKKQQPMRLLTASKKPGTRAAIVLVLATGLLFACASEPASPEAQVRALLEQAEEAAEDRELSALRDFIADEYRDERGQNKQRILGILQYYFLSHKSIYLLTQVKALEFPEPSRAEVGVLVGMAGQPGEGALDWSLFRADVYRFDFTLVDEGGGDWKVVGATWRRGSIEEAD